MPRMGRRARLHAYLIKMVVALFLLPPLLFILFIRLGLNRNAGFFLSLALFVYILIYICLFTNRAYRARESKMKRL